MFKLLLVLYTLLNGVVFEAYPPPHFTDLDRQEKRSFFSLLCVLIHITSCRHLTEKKRRRKSHENTHSIASYRIFSGFLAGWSGAMPFSHSCYSIFNFKIARIKLAASSLQLFGHVSRRLSSFKHALPPLSRNCEQ